MPESVKPVGPAPADPAAGAAAPLVPPAPAPLVAAAPTMPIPAALESPERAFTRKAVIAVAIALAAVLLVMFVYQITQVLVLVFAACLLAVLLTTPSKMLNAYARIPQTYALAIVLIGFLALIVGAIYFIGSTLRAQVLEVKASLGPAINATRESLLKSDLGKWIVEQTGNMGNLQEVLSPDFFLHLRDQSWGIASTTLGVLGSILVVFVVGVYLAISPETYVGGFAALFPVRSRPRVRQVLSAIGNTLQWWFFGQFLSMLGVFFMTLIGLKILGMKSTLALALLAGLFNIIPNFGPILAAIPAVLLAAAPHDGSIAFDHKRAIYVVMVYAIVQAVDGYVVSPLIQKRAVALPPALIMLAQITAFLLLGPVGLLLATPILAAVMVLVRLTYVEDVLGDRSASVRGA